ncbi:tetratricopeptide repeat protein [Hymenobacter busanensis]|uniref:Oxygen sensor histidine kinase NreB n=1 Tax=Hymenobacter busanensis TaxID=2607656 RepID=A0A7L4ZVV8_9BACT|nr:tetratricopeptide repeat protein [Hymenobacter busanensis]KAA9332087.1 tetratricopeptide repeat protein [Hymenobacter busanensis]QHJ07574.1 tetratricopeptide repeat protein [Hymenobacter busanensis]
MSFPFRFFSLAGLLACLMPHLAPAQSAAGRLKADSLAAVVRAHPAADTGRIRLLHNWADALLQTNVDQAQKPLQEALQLSRRLRYRAGEAATLGLQSLTVQKQGEYQQALALANQSLRLYRQAGDSVGTGRAYGRQGSVYAMLGEPEAAARTFLAQLRLADRHRDDAQRATANNSLGQLMVMVSRYPEAIEYLQQAKTFSQRSGNVGQLPSIYRTLSSAYSSLNQFPEATRYGQAALQAARQQGRDADEASALKSLGKIEFMQGRYQAARDYLQRSIDITDRLGNRAESGRNLFVLGNVQNRMQDPKGALRSYRQALQAMQHIGDKQGIQMAYDGIAAAAYNLDLMEDAFQAQRLGALYRDTVLNEETIAKVQEMQTRYETEKKEAQNQLLRKQQLVQQAQLRTQQQVIRRRNTQLLAGLAVALLLGAVGWLLYNRNRLRQQLELEQQRQGLERQRAAAVLEAEENERRRIGSDLHDGIGQLLTAAKLNLHALERQLGPQPQGPQELLDNALSVVDESFREVRGISHNLMPNALIRRGLVQAVRDFLSKLPNENGLRVEVEAFGLDDMRLDPTVESVLFRVIQELVQNIVKHAQASQISLQVIRNDDELTVMVEDNGVGFDPQALGPDAGIGLRNIQTRMDYLGGHAHFDAAPGRGTTVTLEVPLQPVAA